MMMVVVVVVVVAMMMVMMTTMMMTISWWSYSRARLTLHHVHRVRLEVTKSVDTIYTINLFMQYNPPYNQSYVTYKLTYNRQHYRMTLICSKDSSTQSTWNDVFQVLVTFCRACANCRCFHLRGSIWVLLKKKYLQVLSMASSTVTL